METQSAEWLAEVRQARLVLSEQPLTIIGIVSPVPASGVLRLARALAEASVEAGQRALLLSLGDPAGIPDAAGYDVAGRDGVSGISFPFHNPVALKAAFATAAQSYDAVFVDLPAVLDNSGDLNAVTIARACDGVLLLCVSDKVAAPEIVQAYDMLTAAGVKIVGTVLDQEFSPPLSEALARAVYKMTWFVPFLGKRFYKNIQSAQSLQVT